MWTTKQAIEERNYWSDSRTIASMIKDDCFFIKGSKTQINMDWVQQKWMNDTEGDFEAEAGETKYNKWLQSMNIDMNKEVRCTSRFQPCTLCNGKGFTVNPSIDCGGLTYDDMHEDPGFCDEYTSGTYNITCSACNGSKEEHIREYDTENTLYNWCCKKLDEHYQFEYEYAREVAAERKMGC